MKIIILGKFGTGKTTVSNYLIEKYGFKRVMLASGLKRIAELLQDSGKEYELFHLIYDIIEANNLDEPEKCICVHRLIKEMYNELLKLNKKYPSNRNWNIKSLFKFILTGKKPDFIKNRSLLQEIGTNFRDKYGDKIWINYINKKEIEPLIKNNIPVVVDDIRFKNEYDFFNSNDFLPIRINSIWGNREKRLLSRDGEVNEHRLNHISETDLDEYGEKRGISEIFNNSTLEDLLNKVDFFVRGNMSNVR